MSTARAWRNHRACPGGCGELADECMTPGCGSPLGGMTIEPAIGSRATEPCPHTCSCTSDGECPHDCPCSGATA